MKHDHCHCPECSLNAEDENLFWRAFEEAQANCEEHSEVEQGKRYIQLKEKYQSILGKQSTGA